MTKTINRNTENKVSGQFKKVRVEQHERQTSARQATDIAHLNTAANLKNPLHRAIWKMYGMSKDTNMQKTGGLFNRYERNAGNTILSLVK